MIIKVNHRYYHIPEAQSTIDFYQVISDWYKKEVTKNWTEMKEISKNEVQKYKNEIIFDYKDGIFELEDNDINNATFMSEKAKEAVRIAAEIELEENDVFSILESDWIADECDKHLFFEGDTLIEGEEKALAEAYFSEAPDAILKVDLDIEDLTVVDEAGVKKILDEFHKLWVKGRQVIQLNTNDEYCYIKIDSEPYSERIKKYDKTINDGSFGN